MINLPRKVCEPVCLRSFVEAVLGCYSSELRTVDFDALGDHQFNLHALLCWKRKTWYDGTAEDGDMNHAVIPDAYLQLSMGVSCHLDL